MVKYQQRLDEYNTAFVAFDMEITSRIKKLKSEFENINNHTVSPFITEIKMPIVDSLFRPLFINFILSLGLKVTASQKGKFNILQIENNKVISGEIVLFAVDFYEKQVYLLQSTLLKDLFIVLNTTFGKERDLN